MVSDQIGGHQGIVARHARVQAEAVQEERDAFVGLSKHLGQYAKDAIEEQETPGDHSWFSRHQPDQSVVADNHATNSDSTTQTGGILMYVSDTVTLNLQRTRVCGNSINGTASDANQFAPAYPNSSITLDSASTVSGSCQSMLTVNPDGTADYTYIQDAINASFWGGTVSIAAGSTAVPGLGGLAALAIGAAGVRSRRQRTVA